jgi:prepilin-type N-terminal cleavage/methylation domain-containing protein
MKKSQAGFSVLELLIVLVVVSVLAYGGYAGYKGFFTEDTVLNPVELIFGESEATAEENLSPGEKLLRDAKADKAKALQMIRDSKAKAKKAKKAGK